jgi:ABC-type multidrug transport system ATPase subunit
VLLLDEPVSGLDSAAARSVLAHVRSAARAAGQAVVASCHQPAAALWGMFDSVRG